MLIFLFALFAIVAVMALMVKVIRAITGVANKSSTDYEPQPFDPYGEWSSYDDTIPLDPNKKTRPYQAPNRIARYFDEL